MRSALRGSTHKHVKSRAKVDIMLTVEEAEKLVDCDPAALAQLETFLIHAGFRKAAKVGGSNAE